jgi:hypothetical protein
MSGQYNHELKLDRAVQHLERLQSEVKRWLGRHPYFVVSKFDPQRGEHSIWVQPESDPPPELGLIIGDCLHNLRSALDSLVYDLARAYQRGALPPQVAGRSEFPIFIEPKKFKENRNRKIGATDPDVQAAIKELQPFNEWTSFRFFMVTQSMRAHPEAYHPLWLLHKLSVIDKHRERHLTLFGPEQVMFGGPNADIKVATARDATSIKDRTKVLSYRPVDPSGEVDVHFSFALNIAFEAGPPAFGEPVDRVLLRISAFIEREVLPALTPYLITH